MTKKEQLEIERQRRETALKNTFFNRYLLLRYTIALFFFGNIYWLLNQFIRPSFVIVLPITLIILAILAENNQAARFFVFVILLLGLGLCLLNLKRIQEIYERKDKAYQRFIQLEKSSITL